MAFPLSSQPVSQPASLCPCKINRIPTLEKDTAPFFLFIRSLLRRPSSLNLVIILIPELLVQLLALFRPVNPEQEVVSILAIVLTARGVHVVSGEHELAGSQAAEK